MRKAYTQLRCCSRCGAAVRSASMSTYSEIDLPASVSDLRVANLISVNTLKDHNKSSVPSG